jgi:hypothetical protein
VRGGEPGAFGSLNILKTGQTACYDTNGLTIKCSGSGQDAELQVGLTLPGTRFASNTDQTVTDNLTGLIWNKNGNPTAAYKNWQGALDYIKTLNSSKYLGYSDWRLPNVNELKSLINNGPSDSATWLNGQGFTGVQSNYWSSTSARYSTGAWYVNINGGGIYGNSKTGNYYVWPVRGGQKGAVSLFPASSSFTSTIGGTPSTPVVFTITNDSVSSVTVSSITITGTDAGLFSVVPGGSSPCSSLKPNLVSGASCTVNVTFTPSTIGSKSATLNITSNATGASALNVPLSGMASAPSSYTVSSSTTGAGGSLSCPPQISQGTSATCIIAPATGYSLSTLTDNGISVTAQVSGSSYNIVNVTTNHTIVAAFNLNDTVPVNVSCGSANYTSFYVAPKENLCSTGTPSTVTGFGPWNWTCIANGGGVAESCSASKAPAKAGDCDGDGTVTITELQSAINMLQGLIPPTNCVDLNGNNSASADEVQKVRDAFLGADMASGNYNTAIPSSNTMLLNAETTSKIISINDEPSSITGQQKITFSGSNQQLESLKTGTPILMTITPNSPNGFMGKVSSISKDATGNIVVITEPAALTEVFDTLKVNFTTNLGADYFTTVPPDKASTAKDAMKNVGMTVSKDLPYHLHKNLYSDSDLSHDLDFDLKIGLTATIDIDRKSYTILPYLKKAEFIFNYDFTVIDNIVAQSKLSPLKYDNTIPLYGKLFYIPVATPLGPVIVPIKADLDIRITATANIEGQISIKQTMKSGYSVKLMKNGDSDWTLNKTINEDKYTPEKKIGASASLEVDVIPGLKLLVAGMAGPYVNFDLKGKITANPCSDPWIKAEAGVDFNSGVKFKFYALSGLIDINDSKAFDPIHLIPMKIVDKSDGTIPLSMTGTVAGTVTDALTTLPLNGTNIVFKDIFGTIAKQTVTDGTGSYDVKLPPCTYTADYSLPAYTSQSTKISDIFLNTTAQHDEALQPTVSVVNSITPTKATLNQLTTFTLSGTNFIDGMEFSLEGCDTISELPGGTETSRQFSCMPTTAGDKAGEIKEIPGGASIYAFNVVIGDGAPPANTLTFAKVLEDGTTSAVTFKQWMSYPLVHSSKPPYEGAPGTVDRVQLTMDYGRYPDTVSLYIYHEVNNVTASADLSGFRISDSTGITSTSQNPHMEFWNTNGTRKYAKNDPLSPKVIDECHLSGPNIAEQIRIMLPAYQAISMENARKSGATPEELQRLAYDQAETLKLPIDTSNDPPKCSDLGVSYNAASGTLSFSSTPLAVYPNDYYVQMLLYNAADPTTLSSVTGSLKFILP